MRLGIVDAGIAIGWLQRRSRSLSRIDALFAGSASGAVHLVMSVVNLAEVLRNTGEVARLTGRDPIVALRGQGVRFHAPTEEVALLVKILPTALADGFAAATALELGGRLYTTDHELARQLKPTRLAITVY